MMQVWTEYRLEKPVLWRQQVSSVTHIWIVKMDFIVSLHQGVYIMDKIANINPSVQNSTSSIIVRYPFIYVSQVKGVKISQL